MEDKDMLEMPSVQVRIETEKRSGGVLPKEEDRWRAKCG
jgi:hypothetical protein